MLLFAFLFAKLQKNRRTTNNSPTFLNNVCIVVYARKKFSEKNLQKMAQTCTNLLKCRCTKGGMQWMFKYNDKQTYTKFWNFLTFYYNLFITGLAVHIIVYNSNNLFIGSKHSVLRQKQTVWSLKINFKLTDLQVYISNSY